MLFPSGVLTPGGGAWTKVTKTFVDWQAANPVVVATIGPGFDSVEAFFIITQAFAAPDLTTGGLNMTGASGNFMNSNVLATSETSGNDISDAPRNFAAPADIFGSIDLEDSNSDPIDPALLTAGSVDFYYRLTAVST